MSVGHALNRFRPREFNRNVRLFFAFGTSINAGMALFSLLYNLYLLRLSYQEGLSSAKSPAWHRWRPAC